MVNDPKRSSASRGEPVTFKLSVTEWPRLSEVDRAALESSAKAIIAALTRQTKSAKGRTEIIHAVRRHIVATKDFVPETFAPLGRIIPKADCANIARAAEKWARSIDWLLDKTGDQVRSDQANINTPADDIERFLASQRRSGPNDNCELFAAFKRLKHLLEGLAAACRRTTAPSEDQQCEDLIINAQRAAVDTLCAARFSKVAVEPEPPTANGALTPNRAANAERPIDPEGSVAPKGSVAPNTSVDAADPGSPGAD